MLLRTPFCSRSIQASAKTTVKKIANVMVGKSKVAGFHWACRPTNQVGKIPAIRGSVMLGEANNTLPLRLFRPYL